MAGLSVPATAFDDIPLPPDDPDAATSGVLTIAMTVQRIKDPAASSWTERSSQARYIVECLAMTGSDNVIRSMLARSWEASDDLETWTFHLWSGNKWRNDDDFAVNQVRRNVERLVDPAIGASNVGLSSIAALVDDIQTGAQDDDGTPARKPTKPTARTMVPSGRWADDVAKGVSADIPQ